MRTALTASVALCLCATAQLVRAQTPDAQAVVPYEERVVEVNGVSLRYLDFGGEGLPVVFTPAPVRSVEGYAEIASRLKDDYRVLAVGHRDGTGPTGGHAEDLVGFLDALGIERAVFAGNTEPAFRMTYLAEEHPERVAGLVYLAGPPSGAAHLFRDPRSGWSMLMRYWGVGDDFLEEDSSTYRYREDGDFTLSVPALTFVNATGIRGVEEWVFPLMVAGSQRVADDVADMVRSGDPGGPYFARLLEDEAFRDEQLAGIEDAAARAYFQRLAEDETLQAEVERFHDEEIFPAELANWAAFRRAFGDHLRVVELDVPVVTGYEYKDAPELIEPHVRQFLDEVGARREPR